jgi:hypothetical protein
VEGCGSGSGRGRGEGALCGGACVGRCRSSWRWPGRTLCRWWGDCPPTLLLLYSPPTLLLLYFPFKRPTAHPILLLTPFPFKLPTPCRRWHCTAAARTPTAPTTLLLLPFPFLRPFPSLPSCRFPPSLLFLLFSPSLPSFPSPPSHTCQADLEQTGCERSINAKPSLSMGCDMGCIPYFVKRMRRRR